MISLKVTIRERHETADGGIDVTGRTRPERDVAAFVDLCRDQGLWFVARPGPFVMAELKNEGIPYRVYTEHPEIVPTGWDGRPAPTHRRRGRRAVRDPSPPLPARRSPRPLRARC